METIKLNVGETKAEFKKDIKTLVIKNVLNMMAKEEIFEAYEVLFNNQYIKPKTGIDLSKEEFFQEKALFYSLLSDEFIKIPDFDIIKNVEGELYIKYNDLLKENFVSSLTIIKINENYLFLKPVTRELYIKTFNKMHKDPVGVWEKLYNELAVGEKMDTSSVEFLSAYSVVNYILVTKGNDIKKK